MQCTVYTLELDQFHKLSQGTSSYHTSQLAHVYRELDNASRSLTKVSKEHPHFSFSDEFVVSTRGKRKLSGTSLGPII